MKKRFGKKMAAVLCVLCTAVCGAVLFAACTLTVTPFDTKKDVSVIGREETSGTRTAFLELIGLKGAADREGIVTFTGTSAVLAEVKGNSYAIAYDSLGYVTSDVKKLTVNGVEATVANIKNGTYKIARPLNVLYKETAVADGANNAFLTFLKSTNAQVVINAMGYVSTKEGAVDYAPADAANLQGTINISGSTSLQPLMIELVKEFKKLHTKVTVNVSGGGSGTGYKDAENDTSQFGMISEDFDKSKAESCEKYEVAKDGIAIIVNKKNPITDITVAQLKNIYNPNATAEEKITVWADIK